MSDHLVRVREVQDDKDSLEADKEDKTSAPQRTCGPHQASMGSPAV